MLCGTSLIENNLFPPSCHSGCDIRFDVGKNGEVGELPQDHVTASSYYETSPPQKFGEFSDGWCAKDTTNGQYLQVST